MHEYSLMENVIQNILDQLDQDPLPEGEQIREVSLKVGALDIHSEESFRQAFEMLARNTLLDECKLNLTIEAGSLKCSRCGFDGPCPTDQGDGHDPIPVAQCPKCQAITCIIGGRGVQAIDLITSSK